MRADLSHLPDAKRRELEGVIQVLFEEFGDATLLGQGKRKAARILKIILFGSYARGGWVDEPHTAKGYQSDYADIAVEGIALYQADDTEFHQPHPKTPQEAFATPKGYFEEWFPSAIKRFEVAKFDMEKAYQKEAAFDLHQVVERLYHCVLLTCTFHTPHTHNIAFLRS